MELRKMEVEYEKKRLQRQIYYGKSGSTKCCSVFSEDIRDWLSVIYVNSLVYRFQLTSGYESALTCN